MRLYLVQHGEARSEAEDPERSLTIREQNMGSGLRYLEIFVKSGTEGRC